MKMNREITRYPNYNGFSCINKYYLEKLYMASLKNRFTV